MATRDEVIEKLDELYATGNVLKITLTNRQEELLIKAKHVEEFEEWTSPYLVYDGTYRIADHNDEDGFTIKIDDIASMEVLKSEEVFTND